MEDPEVQEGSFEGSAVRRRWVTPQRDLRRNSIATWLLEELPNRLQDLLRSVGVPPNAIRRGRLVERGPTEPYPEWELDVTVRLTDEEGEALLGTLISDLAEEDEEVAWRA